MGWGRDLAHLILGSLIRCTSISDLCLEILSEGSPGSKSGQDVDGVDERETQPERKDGRSIVDHEQNEETDRDSSSGQLSVDNEKTEFAQKGCFRVSLALASKLEEGDGEGKDQIGTGSHGDLELDMSILTGIDTYPESKQECLER